MSENDPLGSTPPPDPVPPAASQPDIPLNYAGRGTAYTGPAPDKDARLWGMLCHLSALAQLVGIPSFVGPLVIWLIKKNEMPFVDDQGKEALNFQITAFVVALIISPTLCIGIGFVLLPALGIVVLIFSIIAAMKANEGVAYRYPLTFRLIK